ncbi:MAG: sugar kinase [Aestuariivirga sp.]|uniref:sugar kinase n=1 Tax=Aestuariivirga sp. TaxID=2650926 RepID=UPI003017F34B
MKKIPCDKKVVLFGELMMRLSTKRHERLIQAREFDVLYSGAEANLGVGLIALGVDSTMVSSVPDNAVGEACLAYMRQFKLNLDHVKRNGFRLGIYFVETGASQRPSTFLYNRKGSSITELKPGDFDWDAIFADKHWFHFTGITPALADSVAAITREACAAARKCGLTVSCDLNFRSKLWSKEKARKVMTGLMEYVDVLFTNEEEAATVFGIAARETDVRKAKLDRQGYADVAVQLREKFGLTHVSISLRGSRSATANDWSGMLYDGSQFYTSRTYAIDYIVDRVGGGDAYSAGIIYGLLTGQDLQDTVEFAAAAGCLKHSIHGDFNLVSFEEIQALVGGDGSGRIQR